MTERKARVAAAARRQLGALSGLTMTEALETLAATSALLVGRLDPALRMQAVALLRTETVLACKQLPRDEKQP